MNIVEVEQVPYRKLRELDVVEKLCFHNLVELRNRLKLYDDGVIDNKVCDISADVFAAVDEREHHLSLEKHAGVRKLDCEPLPARNVQLGHGSFVTMDFGKDIEISVDTKKGVEKMIRGEWHFWIYGISWRIEKNNDPLIGCQDRRERIREVLANLEGKKLIGIEIQHSGQDLTINFENGLNVLLFTNSVEEAEQWMLFTPDKKVLVVGPSNKYTYENAGKD